MRWAAGTGMRCDITARDPETSAPAGSDVLVVVGSGDLRTIALDNREILIGRDEACDVFIEHPSLSRRHAILRPEPPATIQDLDSTNGTRIAGQLCRGGGPVAIEPGRGFEIGPLVFLIVRRRTIREVSAERGDLLQVLDPTPEGASSFVHDIARAAVNVLILGETGVGKDVLASTIHALSGRTGPMTQINCAALSENLLESELFGHEKGSFTGAAAQKIGLIEAAARGTVFLDEVGELTAATQAKLLRVVEQREVLRIGATRPISLDVRFLAATHRDLSADVDAGRFRRDLLFRLDGISLTIPPLRDRAAQIVPLALRFIDQARARTARPALGLEPEAAAALVAHAWPGNVRELKAVIERAMLLARRDQIARRDLAFARAPRPARPVRDGVAPLDLSEAQRAERDRIVDALEACIGNQTRAAKQLGISRSTLVTKLSLYRIPRPRS